MNKMFNQVIEVTIGTSNVFTDLFGELTEFYEDVKYDYKNLTFTLPQLGNLQYVLIYSEFETTTNGTEFKFVIEIQNINGLSEEQVSDYIENTLPNLKLSNFIFIDPEFLIEETVNIINIKSEVVEYAEEIVA